MGVFSDTYKRLNDLPITGKERWEEVFGPSGTSRHAPREENHEIPDSLAGGPPNNSSNINAIRRLLQAFRSNAPGGWSDDRYEESRHFTGINYVAIHRKATLLQQCEFQVYIKDPHHPKGKRPISPHDPPQNGRMCKPWDLIQLLERPNNDDSFGDLMYNWQQQMDLTGSALTWMVPNKFETPMELYPIPTALAIPQTTINAQFPHGYYRIQPLYPYGPFSSYPSPAVSVGAPIPAQWMIRFKYIHPLLRYDGWAPQTALREDIDLFEQIRRSRWYSMKRSVNPSAVLNMDNMEGVEPLPEAEIERIHAEWEAEFQGVENHGKLIVGSPGGNFELFGPKPTDLDYQNGYEAQLNFLLGGFGITKPAAGMIEDSAYATLFATLKQLYWITLQPFADYIANKLTRHLAKFFGDNLIIEIKCKRIDDHEILFNKVGIVQSLRGYPARIIRYIMDQLEMPLDEEMIMELSVDPQMQMAQMQMEQEAAQQSQEVPQEEEELSPEQLEEDELMQGIEEEDEETEKLRPTPETLNLGSLGPRKSIKSLRNYYRSKRLNLNGVH